MRVRTTDPRRGGLLDVLDRVLDKGIVIEAHVGHAVGGIVLAHVDARVRVRSLEALLRDAGPAPAEPVVGAVEAYLREMRAAVPASPRS